MGHNRLPSRLPASWAYIIFYNPKKGLNWAAITWNSIMDP